MKTERVSNIHCIVTINERQVSGKRKKEKKIDGSSPTHSSNINKVKVLEKKAMKTMMNKTFIEH